jgi:hypothetical protein
MALLGIALYAKIAAAAYGVFLPRHLGSIKANPVT